MVNAPWWFTSLMAPVGLVLGVLLKWGIDLQTERSRRRREDELRFLDVRKDAYAAFHDAFQEALVAREVRDRLEPMFAAMADKLADDPTSTEGLEGVRMVHELNRRVSDALNEGFRSAAVVVLVGSPPVAKIAADCRCMMGGNADLDDGQAALNAFLVAAAEELTPRRR